MAVYFWKSRYCPFWHIVKTWITLCFWPQLFQRWPRLSPGNIKPESSRKKLHFYFDTDFWPILTQELIAMCGGPGTSRLSRHSIEVYNFLQTATQQVKQMKVHCFSFSKPFLLLDFDAKKISPKCTKKWSNVRWFKNPDMKTTSDLIIEIVCAKKMFFFFFQVRAFLI